MHAPRDICLCVAAFYPPSLSKCWALLNTHNSLAVFKLCHSLLPPIYSYWPITMGCHTWPNRDVWEVGQDSTLPKCVEEFPKFLEIWTEHERKKLPQLWHVSTLYPSAVSPLTLNTKLTPSNLFLIVLIKRGLPGPGLAWKRTRLCAKTRQYALCR